LGLFRLENALGTPCSSLPVPEKGLTRKLERDFLAGDVVIGQRVVASN